MPSELLSKDAELARERPLRKRAIAVPMNPWLGRLVRESPAFQAKVAEGLAAIRVGQDLVALRESRGLSQAQLARRVGVTQAAIARLESAQADNIELRTLVRVAAAVGAHVDVSIRPGQRAERQSRQPARPKTKPS